MIDVATFRDYEARGLITGRSHPTHDLIIWNYTARCQYEQAWDDITMQARGLITSSTGTIVARPFRKFMNIEQHQGPIPLEPFTITEKMDGSLGILFFVEQKPYIATRGSFTSEQAVKGNALLQYYRDFPFNPAYTYLFEIIYPENRIVVDYGKREFLMLLAVIETATGRNIDIHQQKWPFPVVKMYDGITDIAQLRRLESANAEGFVIRFASGLRLKVKFAEYMRLHRLLTQINARVIWDLVRMDQPLDALLERVPDEFYSWVSNTRTSLLNQFAAIESASLQALERVKGLPTRKEQAAIIAKERYSAVIFRMLDGKDYSEIIWKLLRPQAERPFREDES